MSEKTNNNSRGNGYERRTSAKLANAELIFNRMKFVAGSGDKEKTILRDVGARIKSGRKYRKKKIAYAPKRKSPAFYCIA